jgi:hypothetical protein
VGRRGRAEKGTLGGLGQATDAKGIRRYGVLRSAPVQSSPISKTDMEINPVPGKPVCVSTKSQVLPKG